MTLVSLGDLAARASISACQDTGALILQCGISLRGREAVLSPGQPKENGVRHDLQNSVT
jgi:hypothetical protein